MNLFYLINEPYQTRFSKSIKRARNRNIHDVVINVVFLSFGREAIDEHASF